jgi:hypothetical protein
MVSPKAVRAQVPGPFHSVNYLDRVEHSFSAIRHLIAEAQLDPGFERRADTEDGAFSIVGLQLVYKRRNQKNIDDLLFVHGAIAVLGADSRGWIPQGLLTLSVAAELCKAAPVERFEIDEFQAGLNP